MFATRSEGASSQATEVLLSDLRFPIETRDHKSQIIVTRWLDVRSLPIETYQAFVPEGRKARFQLYIFVSPFAEPARVYVGAILDVMSPWMRTYSPMNIEAW